MYLTLKYLHLVAAISWMAGILYLYRLLIYRSERGDDPKIRELLNLMAGRLYRYITVPAMTVAVIAGMGLPGLNPALWSQGWFHVKLTLLVLLIGATHMAGAYLKRADGRSPKPLPAGRRLRFLNEVPTLLMLVIVGMAVFRPF